MKTGFNATLTAPVDKPDKTWCGGDQIREMGLKLHPDLKETLTRICDDPKNIVVILSRSDRAVLDEGELSAQVIVKAALQSMGCENCS
ncbi:alpha,alpha-trehalose-phosphate synthase [UDP-forming] 1-like isoform X2 [Rutidosis leptorrhynchoides]|uniref:alpha,alpha-trehalose-phosphate synthase [UDP-forming] 1-like n=1 Tax=Rutidosis leptorrhynchoides TaxID=125765 RepID=UPI003A996B0F